MLRLVHNVLQIVGECGGSEGGGKCGGLRGGGLRGMWRVQSFCPERPILLWAQQPTAVRAQRNVDPKKPILLWAQQPTAVRAQRNVDPRRPL